MSLIDAGAVTELPNDERRKAAARLRELTIHGASFPLVLYRAGEKPDGSLPIPFIEWDDLVRQFPGTPPERLDRALVNLKKLSPHFGEPITSRMIDAHFDPVVFADSYEAREFILRELHKEGWVEYGSRPSNPITVTAKGWSRAEEIGKGSLMGPKTTQVFLSHATSDKDLAGLLKTELERRVPGIDVFLSSDPTDLPAGVKWPEEVQDVLRRSGIILLLATKRGLARTWVWFEVGCAWFLPGRRIIPLCLGEVRKNSLPTPLSDRMALNCDEEADVQTLLQQLAGSTGSRVADSAVGSVISRLKQLDEGIARQTASSSGVWQGVEWDGKFLAYSGPLEHLPLIEDEVFRQEFVEVLERNGYTVRLSDPARLSSRIEVGYRIVHLTDRQSWRRRIGRPAEVLIAKPK
ncbi:MAG: toll/interleukin-1 receptor domain-containing protein [Candidatus Omnitrophota bacterium]|nr:toll/interleukin-1 receptor domain-containing protein [Candidatus Omnitrophota bacterium]